MRPPTRRSASLRSPSPSTWPSTSPRRPLTPGPPTRKFSAPTGLSHEFLGAGGDKIQPDLSRGFCATSPRDSGRTASLPGVADFRSAERRMALGSAETGRGIAQAPDYALLAEHHHGIEERRGYRLTHDRHARGVDQQAGFHARGFRDGACGAVAGIVVPFREGRERLRELRKELRHFRIFPEFFYCRRVAWEIVAEKGPRPRRKIREQANPRPQQVHRLRKPRVVSSVRAGGGARGPLRPPQTAAPQFLFHFRQQVFDRKFLQILCVEPLGFR